MHVIGAAGQAGRHLWPSVNLGGGGGGQVMIVAGREKVHFYGMPDRINTCLASDTGQSQFRIRRDEENGAILEVQRNTEVYLSATRFFERLLFFPGVPMTRRPFRFPSRGSKKSRIAGKTLFSCRQCRESTSGVLPTNWMAYAETLTTLPRIRDANNNGLVTKCAIHLYVDAGGVRLFDRFLVPHNLSVPCIFGTEVIEQKIEAILPCLRKIIWQEHVRCTAELPRPTPKLACQTTVPGTATGRVIPQGCEPASRYVTADTRRSGSWRHVTPPAR